MSYATAKADLHRLIEYQYNLLDGTESGNIPDIFTNSASFLSNYAGSSIQDAVTFESAAREAGVSLWSAGRVAILRQIVVIARELNYTGNDTLGAFAYWVRYMTDSGEFAGGSVSEYFDARGVTRGTLNSPTNTKLVRVASTPWSQDSQLGSAESITARITSPSVASDFTLSLTGQDAGRDIFDQQGSGESSNLKLHKESTQTTPFVKNPNLKASTSGQGDAVTSLPNWTLSDPGHWTVDLVKKFRANTQSIETATNTAYISQVVPNFTKLGIPYIPYAIVNPTGFTGTIDLTLGAKSDTALSVGSSGSWNIVVPANLDGRWFPNQFDTTGGLLKLKVNRTAGSLVVGKVGILPLEVFAFGSFWGGMVGDSDPVLNATATTTDTITVAGKYAHVFALLGLSLPVSGTNKIADPT